MMNILAVVQNQSEKSTNINLIIIVAVVFIIILGVATIFSNRK